MKTRIFTMTGIILLTAATIADAADHSVKNTSVASGHENATVQLNQHMVSSNSFEMTTTLEAWIANRENWEQEGEETTLCSGLFGSFMLNEWIAARDNWEQEGQEMGSAATNVKSISLQEWIAGRESWEQESVETFNYLTSDELAGMEDWIAGISEWEQK